MSPRHDIYQEGNRRHPQLSRFLNTFTFIPIVRTQLILCFSESKGTEGIRILLLYRTSYLRRKKKDVKFGTWDSFFSFVKSGTVVCGCMWSFVS